MHTKPTAYIHTHYDRGYCVRWFDEKRRAWCDTSHFFHTRKAAHESIIAQGGRDVTIRIAKPR